jgi:hypothetical protein
MPNALAIAGLFATLLVPAVPGPASAATAAPAAIISVSTVNGSGCPAGTTSIAVSPNGQDLMISYGSYYASVGVGSSPTDFRKNCQLNLAVSVTPGFTYAVTSARYNGDAHLEAGASATVRSSYYFQGQSQTTTISHLITGPYDDNWQVVDTSGASSGPIYAPCGQQRNININSELRVAAGSSDTKSTSSWINMNTSAGYHFAFKACAG